MIWNILNNIGIAFFIAICIFIFRELIYNTQFMFVELLTHSTLFLISMVVFFIGAYIMLKFRRK